MLSLLKVNDNNENTKYYNKINKSMPNQVISMKTQQKYLNEKIKYNTEKEEWEKKKEEWEKNKEELENEELEKEKEINFLNFLKKKQINKLNKYGLYINQLDNTSMFNENDILITRKSDTYSLFKPQYNIEIINKLNNFILIVDFPNYGGGTTFFLNTIVSRYKNNNNFLIIRKINDAYTFNINEEYELKQQMNLTEAINFLKTYKNSIIKIFVNHTLNIDYEFLNTLFILKKEVTAITHDYFLIIEKYDPTYKEIMYESLKKNIININKYDKIITQNIINLKYFGPFISDKKKIIVSNLPDFKDCEDRIETNNNYIVIGIIGLISINKGQTILLDLIDYYKDNDNIKFIIFGKTNNFENTKNANSYIYNSVSELNILLKKYSPNLLLELSIWPETYSYTLTLSMITQLPILYFKKPIESVIKKRLLTYEKVYDFCSINEFNNIIYKIKQNYFYTIKNDIYYNSFWDNYFSNTTQIQIQNSNKYLSLNDDTNFELNIQNKNIIIVTSKLIVSKNKFSYIKKRSIYTAKERFEQTLNTISSIRNNIPDSYIILIDNSKIIDESIINILNKNVDYFINITDDDYLNYFTDEYQYKGIAELCQLLKIYNLLLKNINFKNIKHFFKISGRYTLNSDFDYNNYDNDLNINKQNEHVKNREYWYTSFYKINKNFIHSFFDKLHLILTNKEKYEKYDLEVIFSSIFKEDFTQILNLGVTENIAVWKQINNI
jgi:hypothetical protein